MARVTADDVLAIRPSTADMTPFISAATLLVDEYLGAAGLSDPLLFEIERWWTAHLAESADPRTMDRRIGQTALKREQAKLGIGLEGTAYGQQVLLLDTSGTLETAAAETKRAVVDVF